MRPLPKLCETCRGKKRPLSTGARNFYVDACGQFVVRFSETRRSMSMTDRGDEDRWSCGRKCAKRRRARLAHRGVESRVAAFQIERVNLQFMDAPKTRLLKNVRFDNVVFGEGGYPIQVRK